MLTTNENDKSMVDLTVLMSWDLGPFLIPEEESSNLTPSPPFWIFMYPRLMKLSTVILKMIVF